ncbi:MAG: TraB/GumN family protein [Cytophagaceae bacterium]|jgi:uncharacterized protein YbaP (TraB family)|nr:TraB/GumN family protein [Cytophagaceae bacterium]
MKSYSSTLVLSLLLVLGLGVLNAQSVSSKKEYQGLLWEISGNGLKEPSYLYGTMHVSKKLAFRLSDTFFLAIKNADVVALELNPDTWMEDMIKTGTYQNRTRYSSYQDFYSSFEWNLLNQKRVVRLLARSHSFVNYMLYRKNASEDNFEENTFLDLFIYQSGRKLKKQITGLENYLQVQELSAKATMPVDKKILEKEAKNKKNTYVEKKKDVRLNAEEALQDAYRKGDLDAIDSMTRVNQSTDYYIHFMIDERNRLMVERMDSIMKKQRLFTGVGAAHLPGQKGMIEMLRAKGYTVRPVGAKSGRVAERMKQKLEETIHPMQYKTSFVPDSMFSVDLPGPMYESADEYGFSEYFYPEMTNGAYYNIYRLNTYAPVTGVSQDSMLSIVENLLYEGIPGKIVRKTKGTQQSIPFLDITNLTRRGDYQRYKIFVTPLELIVFKMHGNGKFVLTNGDRYFNSIQWNDARRKGLWNNKHLEVAMPGPRDENYSSSFLENKQVLEACSFDDKNTYWLMETALHDYQYIEEDTFELERLAYQFADNIHYKIQSKSLEHIQGRPVYMANLIPSKEEINSKEEAFHTSIFSKRTAPLLRICVKLQGPVYYFMATTAQDTMKALEFFKSLRVKSPDRMETMTLQTFVDTTLHYKVQTPVLPDQYATYGYLLSHYKSKRDKELYEPRSDQRNFTLPLLHQEVRLDYIKLNDFRSFKDTAEVWKNRLERLNPSSSFILKNKNSGQTKQYYFMDYTFSDTASARIIAGRVILKNNSLYLFSHVSDTIQGYSYLYKTLTESFQLLDDFPGDDALKSKGHLLFNAIDKGDSLRVNELFKNLPILEFEDQEVPALIRVIDNSTQLSRYLQEGVFGARNLLIEKLSDRKHSSIVPALERWYLKAQDSSLIQVKILTALARQKTINAYSKLAELIQLETPIADEEQVELLFLELHDSLELSAKIISKLIPFARYPEYQLEVYDLLAKLIDSNLVAPSQYLAYKLDILLDAQAEIKRVLSAEELKKNNKLKLDSDSDDSGDYYDGTRSSYASLNYAKILLPFYEEKQVKRFFERTYKSENTYLALKIDVLKVKNKVQVPDSNWRRYAASDFDRLEMYRQLNVIKRLDLFDSTYLTQEHLSRALIYEDYTQENNDSIRFVDKRLCVIKGQKGYVYYFRRYNKTQESWVLDYTGVQPENQQALNYHPQMIKGGIRFRKEAEIKSILQDSAEDIRLYGRKRAKRFGSYSF